MRCLRDQMRIGGRAAGEPPHTRARRAVYRDGRDGMARIIVYTGKGGVGKTSVAAATGLLCAERGYKTVVVSTGIAHSLSDSVDVPLGAEPVQRGDDLLAQ